MEDNLPISTPPVVETPASTSSTEPSPSPAKSEPSRGLAPIILLLTGVLIVSATLFFLRRSQEPTAPAPAATIAVGEPAPAATPAQFTPPASSQTIAYSLPANWTQSPAEGQLTPYYNFLKRLRSPDACYTVVVTQFATSGMSLNEFLAEQYPGTTLTELKNPTQYALTGLESFTVKGRSEGEAFSLYVRGQSSIFGLLASYQVEKADGTICAPASAELDSLANSVQLR